MRTRRHTSTAGRLRTASDPTPLYFRLRTLLREAIESLQYPPGSRLPAEREMARIYGVSRITVRQALDALAAERIIRRTRGRNGGTFVEGRPAADTATKLVGGFNVVVSRPQFRRIEIDAFDVRAANAEIAAALHLPAATPIRYLERRFSGARGPVAFVRNFLPLSIGERLQQRDLSRMTLYEVMTKKLRVKVAEVHDEVEAVLADTQNAPRLGVAVGTPMLSIRRLYLAAGDEPVNFTILMTRNDRYKVSVRLQDGDFE